MKHVMIDLETLGIVPGSVILTLGAVRFDPEADDLGGVDPLQMNESRAFYRRIRMESCVRDLGMVEDPETVAWWSRQDPLARKEAWDAEPRYDPAVVLREFVSWFQHSKFIWSHGSTFDVVMVEEALRRCRLEPTWKFWNVRDTRTLYAFTGVTPVRGVNHHHALWDALEQAEAVQRAYKKRNTDIA